MVCIGDRNTAKSLQLFPTLCTLSTVACQAPVSVGFSRHEYWSELPFSPQGTLADGFFTSSATLGGPW